VHGWHVGMVGLGNPHFCVLTSKEIDKHLTVIKCGYDNNIPVFYFLFKFCFDFITQIL